jgi:LmbE family N-acetylglucosaminyl deacetylase
MPATVVLSPHFDDAVLSCWRVLTAPGELTVLNVFGGVPPEGSPPGWWDRHLGSPDDAVRTRSEEDRRALSHAGRSARTLGFLDAQYRDGDQPAQPVADALRAAVPAGATVYAPASIGLNPDHEAVRAAALELRELGTRVVLYADLPHAAVGGWPPWVVGKGGDERVASAWDRVLARSGLPPESLTPVANRLARDEFERKVAAVREYASQIRALEGFFRVRVDDPERLGYEVEWRVPPAASGSSSASAAARNPAAS